MAGAVSKPVELVFIRDNTRRYVIWEGEIDGQHIVIHGFGALFPERYLPSRSADLEASIWHCPVRTCGQAFATPPDLGDHFLKFHAGAILHDHLDGTFSVLPQDPESAYDANRQPYVASQGLQKPSLRQPSHSVPLQPGPGALDTPAVPVDNHDKSNPQTGNKTLASSSEVNSNDESDGSSDNDSDESGTDASDDGEDANESDGSDSDDSDKDDDNESDGSDSDDSDEDDTDESDGSDDALPMESQDPSSKKRKANNDEFAPEPKKAKSSQALVGSKGKRVKEWDMKDTRISKSGTQRAEWETRWGMLPHSGGSPHTGRPALAYSSTMLTRKHVVDDDDTTFQIAKIPQTHPKSFQGYDRALLFVVKQGAVSVLVTKNQLFTISTDGCWSIKPGQTCSMKGMHPETETVVYIYGRPG